MAKLLIAGVWICLVTLGSIYAVVAFKSETPKDAKVEEFFGGLDYVKTEPVSVPIIEDGAVQGYVIAQFVFTADGKLLRRMSVPPQPFLVDEAYRTIYDNVLVDFTRPEKADLTKLTSLMRDNVNARFGTDLVKDVLVEQVNFVSANTVRNRLLGQQ